MDIQAEQDKKRKKNTQTSLFYTEKTVRGDPTELGSGSREGGKSK
jgi:hypothetical protein